MSCYSLPLHLIEHPTLGIWFKGGFPVRAISIIPLKRSLELADICLDVFLSSNLPRYNSSNSELYPKKSGVQTVLIPNQNKNDLEKIKNGENNPIDDKFKVVLVNNIWDIINFIFSKNVKVKKY